MLNRLLLFAMHRTRKQILNGMNWLSARDLGLEGELGTIVGDWMGED